MYNNNNINRYNFIARYINQNNHIYKNLYPIMSKNKFAHRILILGSTIVWKFKDKYIVHDPIGNIIRDNLQAGDIFYDIGAYIGIYSIYASRKFKNMKVFSFEPNPKTYDILTKNIKALGLKNVKCFQLAVDSDNKDREFLISSIDACSTFYNDKNMNHWGTETGKVIVKCDTLNNIIKQNKMLIPTVVKIDVEGNECEVIKGATELLKHKPKLFIEIHKEEYRKWLIEYLVPLGYNYKSMDKQMVFISKEG